MAACRGCRCWSRLRASSRSAATESGSVRRSEDVAASPPLKLNSDTAIRPASATAAGLARVAGQRLLQLHAGVVRVVVGQVVLGRGHVGRPVVAVDDVVGLDEHVQHGVVQGRVGLVGPGEDGPAVEGAADGRRVGGPGRVAVEDLLALAPPPVEVALRGGDEPAVGGLGRGRRRRPRSASRPSSKWPGSESGWALRWSASTAIASRGGRSRPAARPGRSGRPARPPRPGRAARRPRRRCGPGRQGLELAGRPAATAPTPLSAGRIAAERLHGQLVPAGGDLQLGLVPVGEVGRERERRQVLGQQRLDPPAGHRLAGEVDGPGGGGGYGAHQGGGGRRAEQ